MQFTLELGLILAAVLLVLSVTASKISDRFGIPALLVFLVVGMLAGSDGPGGIYFDDASLAQSIGVIALVVILFSGGLDTEWKAVRPVLKEGLTLATLGTFITALLVGLFAYLIFDLSLVEGMLLGSIVSSTDAAAVFAVLRSRGVHLKGRLKPLLELESGSNDPMAVFLTVGMIQLALNPGRSPLQLVPLFFQQMILGVILGYLAGILALYLINRLKLGYDSMYPVLTMGMIFLSFGVTATLGGSGFLAVYVTGLVLGRADFLHKRSLIRFYNSAAWLMQIIMFLTLGLFVFPSHLVPVILPGLGLALALMLVARPVSVMIGMLISKYNLRERIFVSWVGLRGAVPVILALYPKLANLPNADLIFNVVFFVVLTSVLIQGTLIAPVAKLLKVDAPLDEKSAAPLEMVPVEGWRGRLREIRLPTNCRASGKAIYELGLPPEYLIVLIKRNGNWIVPNGGVVLQDGDVLLGLTSASVQLQMEQFFSCNPSKPESP